MKRFNVSFLAMMASFVHHRELIFVLAKRDVLSRYRSSVLGVVWSFIQPGLMLLIYTFVFSIIFKSRWHTHSDSKTEFAVVLFSGLIVFNLFAECLNRSPNIIYSHINYVKKVVFPLEILPLVNLLTVLFQTFVSFVVWLIFYILFFDTPHITLFLLPVAILPIVFITLGVSWILASLGVYLRDMSQMIGILTTIVMFMSPIFYPIAAIPENYRNLLEFNPLTFGIEIVRDVSCWGTFPPFGFYALYLSISILISWLGFVWFQKTRKGFADVL